MQPVIKPSVTLLRKEGRLFVRMNGSEEKPAKVVWARPVSGMGAELAILDDKKKEVCTLQSLNELDPDSRKLAEEELLRRYLLARITRVLSTTAFVGTRYWNVETELGPRQFVIKNAHKDVTWLSDDHVVLRCTLGNRYEIPSLAKLDPVSLEHVERII
ncbi:MAG TPA: DUF1854 domain-containing protein [Planctomycetota bacterium]|jgi:hypothetical protein